MNKTNYEEIYQENIKSNGLAAYTFYIKKQSKNSILITKKEYDLAINLNKIGYGQSTHMGVKTNISKDLSNFVLFSSKINELNINLSSTTEDNHEYKILKGVNRTIFIDNENFSKYYTSSYKVKDFPRHAKSYFEDKNNIEKYVNETVKAYKYSYKISFKEKKY